MNKGEVFGKFCPFFGSDGAGSESGAAGALGQPFEVVPPSLPKPKHTGSRSRRPHLIPASVRPTEAPELV